jgi:hypothetical protein
MTYILEKHGNNLYVAPEGNDQSAIKGFTSKAWKTLAAALAASEDGDVIIVQKGEHTITSNLQLDPLGESRTIVFEENANLSIPDGVYLYSGDEATAFNDDGLLKLALKGSINKTDTGFMYRGTDYSGNIDFDIHELNGPIRFRGRNGKIKIDKIDFNNLIGDQSILINCFYRTDTHPTNPDVPVVCTYDIDLGEVNIPNDSGLNSITSINCGDFASGSYYRISAKKTFVGTHTLGPRGNYRYSNQFGTVEADIIMDLGSITNLSTTNNTTTNFYTAFKNTHSAISIDGGPTNGSFVVKANSVITPNMSGLDATSFKLDNSNGLIQIGQIEAGDYGIQSRVDLTNGSTLIINSNVKVDGDKPALSLVGSCDATSKIIIRGRYENTGAYPAITIDDSLSTYVQFENVVYINNGTVAGLQTDAACTVNIVSAATNVLIGNVDVNVTFNGGTVLRDANFK